MWSFKELLVYLEYHVGDRDAELPRLGAVEIGKQLRHVDLIAGHCCPAIS